MAAEQAGESYDVEATADMRSERNLWNHYKALVRPSLRDSKRFYSFRFVCDRKFMVYKNNRTRRKPDPNVRCLLTSFVGGSVFMPQSAQEDFLRHLAFDISQKNNPTYWNQIAYLDPGWGCRLMADVDCTRVLAKGEIWSMARIFSRTLEEYYTDFAQNPIPVYIATCGPRLKKGQLSTGLHLLAHVRVTYVQARQILFAFNLALQRARHVNMVGVEVDGAIYKEKQNSCSTRMIYSHKKEKCPLCQGDDSYSMSCQMCRQGVEGKAVSKHTYVPFACVRQRDYTADKKFYEQHNQTWLQRVGNYSLWSLDSDVRTTYHKPSSHSAYTVDEAKPELDEKGKPKPCAKAALRKKHHWKNGRDLDPSHEAYQFLEEFFENVDIGGKKIYEKLQVERIFSNDKQNKYIVNVTGHGMHWCPYKGGEHGSNRIYFKIFKSTRQRDEAKMTVECFSKKGCDKKKRVEFKLPFFVTKALFTFKYEHPPPLPTVRKRTRQSNSSQGANKRHKRTGNTLIGNGVVYGEDKESNLTRLRAFYKNASRS